MIKSYVRLGLMVFPPAIANGASDQKSVESKVALKFNFRARMGDQDG